MIMSGLHVTHCCPNNKLLVKEGLIEDQKLRKSGFVLSRTQPDRSV
jgi:hypothetical protein